ncbi:MULTISPECIES: tetraacyldisaccharide 4'-kinase [Psychrobacter]|jgi:tetraacyldisaccharide 4'-kinase|uniref:tetraacyldisaccharide 4'-kinase n=1 Tax=Psychrobacter TaxID=497 RepID=UPI000C33911D|nr:MULTISPECIES: tetraacyldisaccharide 4'-kinase [Psychrobacter]MBA6245333.1 tetraacyldisaccharide 4'-kinase [Psychrobacter sp. Urea-trap-18]MBA6286925.1 tetraacyldisaccharide 4'-kinase [Psychrobacter sp. Urea-trap-16]MBA6317893.1 tetraacyldisaccharide 4'-kinase [Psychrobacter sp. Urea-trap-20]MBA6335138.1 tetraacyldisaccharide 4'-kinase [Psychrobacter sp. Urea-trap-19]PKG60453.1 tetraacyldisaccharide 4'-kinase [Psychrobacter sp. Choline-3u-12]
MSIETIVTRAWQRQAVWLWLLLPISWLYGFITLLRRQAYKAGLLSSYRAPIPVMVIGNISVGGSGKTPLIIALVSYLQKKGVKVGIISRGYGGDTSQMPALVSATSLPHIVGDEPCLIAHMTGTAIAVCPDRQQAIATLLKAEPDLQLIIADDGLQHYALQRDIEWIVVDAARGFGNKQLLPTGFLREPMSRLEGANVIYHEKPSTDSTRTSRSSNKIQSTDRLTMHLQADELQRLWNHTSSTAQLNSVKPTNNSRVHAVSGIGYPQRFFDTLESIGFEVIGHPYPDHYDFSLAELLRYGDYPIIVTSKDAVKISALLVDYTATQALNDEYVELVSRLWVLPVTAVLSENNYHNLDEQLKALGIRIDHDMNTSALL